MTQEILVTGGAGYIGSVAVELLLEKGYKVIVIDDISTGYKDAVFKESKFYNCSLADKEILNTVFKENNIDLVMHFAAAALVSESITNPKKYFDINFIQGNNLLEAMVKNNVKNIIFSSTCATYGIPNDTSISISEDIQQKPINSYGQSKLLFEQSLKWYKENHHINYIGLRYFNVAGATENRGEHHNPETHLIPVILKSIKNQNGGFKVFGTDYPTKDGTAIRDYVHVIDLVEGHLKALEAIIGNNKYSNFYNLGCGEGYSVLEIINATEKVLGQKIKYEVAPRREGDPPMLVANIEKIQSELGWKPLYSSLEKIISSANKHM